MLLSTGKHSTPQSTAGRHKEGGMGQEGCAVLFSNSPIHADNAATIKHEPMTRGKAKNSKGDLSSSPRLQLKSQTSSHGIFCHQ